MGHIAHLSNQFKSMNTFEQSYDYMYIYIYHKIDLKQDVFVKHKCPR